MFPKTRRALVVAGSAVTSVLFSAGLLAQVPGPGHALRKDYAMEWAGRINLFGVVAAMALVGYVLVFKRRQIAAAASQWMLFIGICVMPLPVMLLGSAVGLEQAKDVSFCRQCHVMRQFVDDMTDPASNRLAAVHFKNRYIQRSHCYVCHTDYGLFGTMEAKLAGVGHIWKESTASYALPVTTARPYQFMICLDCHAQSVKFERVPDHRGLVAKVASGEAGCTSCHGLSHLPRSERGARP
jgi:cytochrome c nitrite reductase small subunit